MIKEAILVGIGGFVGSISRYLVSMAMIGWLPGAVLPAGTFTVNAVGSFLIGLFLAVIGEGSWYYLCITGFCGGFTTFSTFSAELVGMLRSAHYGQSILYIIASIVICLAAAWLGMYSGNRFNLVK